MTKKALIVGVNYIGQPCALRGCINDAWNVCSFITHHYGYEPQNITLLSDDPDHIGTGLPEWAPPVPNPEKPRKSKKEKKDKKDKKAKKGKEDKEEKPDKKDKKDKKEEKKAKKEKEEKPDKKDKKDKKEEKKDKKDKKKDKKGKGDEEDEGETRDVDTTSSSSSSADPDVAGDDDDDTPAEVFEGYGEDIAYYAYQFTSACRGIEEITRGGPASVKRDTATRANIIRGIEWLIAGAQPGDNLYFHFSGHGSQSKDLDGDEDDGFDETICPQDYKTAGMIVDDELHAKLVEPLPAGVHLQVVLDCCHSGTGMDLPFVFKASGPPGTPFEDKSSKKPKKGKAIAAAGGAKESEATVVMISGCQDDQCSADVNMKGGATGAVTFSYICALISKGFDLSYAELLYTMKVILAENSKSIIQCPQLSTNTKGFNFDQKFLC
eukprot:TRINITY_DN41_c0_g1_i5.p1 TRINITY_DN41_c0_g1~~TRINITY_DN41_c0_g1_i5.p1  ORF type:complete len:476 (-),score=268.06 TRINITY_DN41_c0_g1_i5:109-1416(-)